MIKFHLIFCWIPTSFPDWYGRWQGPWLLRPFSTIRETADLNTSRFGMQAKSVLNEGYNPTRTGMQASRDNCQLCSENRQVLEYFQPGQYISWTTADVGHSKVNLSWQMILMNYLITIWKVNPLITVPAYLCPNTNGLVGKEGKILLRAGILMKVSSSAWNKLE